VGGVAPGGTALTSAPATELGEPVQVPRKRGRPPGAKNKEGHRAGWPRGKPRGSHKPAPPESAPYDALEVPRNWGFEDAVNFSDMPPMIFGRGATTDT
jgi:hypothetical protein